MTDMAPPNRPQSHDAATGFVSRARIVAAFPREALEALVAYEEAVHDLLRRVPELVPAFQDLVEVRGIARQAEDYAYFYRGVRHPDFEAGLTYHSRFARCPECGHATVGIGEAAINHRDDCTAALALPEGTRDDV